MSVHSTLFKGVDSFMLKESNQSGFIEFSVLVAIGVAVFIVGTSIYISTKDDSREKSEKAQNADSIITETPSTSLASTPTPKLNPVPLKTSVPTPKPTIVTTPAPKPVIVATPRPQIILITPVPQSQTTINEARSAYSFLIPELMSFNNEIDNRIRELRDVVRQNYSDNVDFPAGYQIARNFELEADQYITRWETMKRDNNNAIFQLNTVTDVEQYIAVAKLAGNLLLISKKQFYNNLEYIKILLERYVQDIKAALQQDINNLNSQYYYLTATPTPTPYYYIPPPEPEICQQIRDNPDYSKTLKQRKLDYYGCYY